jgi:phosphonopyruvate decarboxylase
MGECTLSLLQVLGIPYFIFSLQCDWEKQLHEAIIMTEENSFPVALVIEDHFFEDRHLSFSNEYELSAEKVIGDLFRLFDGATAVVCTTGKIGRLFYAINEKNKPPVTKYLLNVGAMGHASSLALGLASFSKTKVFLLDGDGSLLMHMGSLAVAGTSSINNFNYILLNNGIHQSVGGQPTKGFDVDFCMIAKGCGFESVNRIETRIELEQWAKSFHSTKQFAEIRINTDMPNDLPRPRESFPDSKENLMKALQL